MKKLKSESGAESALRGFRTQTLYIVNRILNFKEEELKFQPEGEEDLAVYGCEENLKEIVQIKNYTTNLSLSNLSPGKDNSFLKRSLKILKKSQTPDLNLVVFGKIGPELYNAIKKDGPNRKKVKNKLIKTYEYTEEEVEMIFNNIVVESVQEDKIIKNVKKCLKEIPQAVDYEISFELLMYWIYQLSETREFVNKQELIKKLDQIGMFLKERSDFHDEYGNSIIPLDYMEKAGEQSQERLEKEFYSGVDAKLCHIKNELDVIREEKLMYIDKCFEDDNVVIIHGASGQGKSTLAYRYLYEYFPENYSYKINYVNSKHHAHNIINTLYGISKSVNLPLIIYIDVEPGKTEWVEIVKSIANNYSKFKILVTVREEDWKRASLTGSNLLFSEIEINLTSTEARKIYQSLSEKRPNMKFRDFEEAWFDFGEEGPLLEFTYLITQGQTLKERLRQQIENIEEEIRGNKEPNQLELLKIVSLAGAYDGKVNLSSLLSKVKLNSPKRTLNIFEKEYLIRRSENGQYLEGLHSIRSKILTEILFDPGISPKKEYINDCISVLVEEDLEIFLLHFFIEFDKYQEVLNFLKKVQFESWEGLKGVSKSLIWLGIKKYIEENRDVINDAYKILGYSWSIGFDLSEAMYKEPIKIFDEFEEIDEININPNVKKTINDCINTLTENRNKIYKYVKEFLKTVKISNINIHKDKGWSSCGEVIFWLGKLNIKRNINFDSFEFKNGIKTCSLENMADMLAGLYYYNSNDSKNKLTEVRPLLIKKFKRKYKVPIIEEKGAKITLHCIIDLNKFDKEDIYEKSVVHEQIITNLYLIRKIYPDKEVFASQGYGHKLDIIPNNYDDTEKEIPIKNLPLRWLTKINSIFSEVSNWKYRPDNWENYIDEVTNKRKKIVSFFDKLIIGLSKHFKKQKEIKIIGHYISYKEWEELIEFFTTDVPFPKIVVDEWGFTSENKEKNDISGLLPKVSLNIQRYDYYNDLFRKYKKSIRNFLYQCYNIILVQTKIKGKSKSEKEETLNFLKKIGIETNEHEKRISFNNLKEALKIIRPFQNEFERLFNKYLNEDEYSNLIKSESDVLNTLFYMWYEFSINYFQYDMNIKETAEKKVDKIKQKIKDNIRNELEEISNKEVNIKLINDKFSHYDKTYRIILMDLSKPLKLYDYLEKIFRTLRKNFKSINKSFLKRALLELEYPIIKIIPLAKEKLVNQKVFIIRLYRLLDKDNEELNIFDLCPEELDDKILESLNLERWSEVFYELNMVQKLQNDISNLYYLVSHLNQLSDLIEMIDEKNLAYKVVNKYFNDVSQQINSFRQNSLDILSQILNKFNYTEKELRNNTYKQELIKLLLDLHEIIFLKKIKETNDDFKNNIFVSLDLMKEWEENLMEALILVQDFSNLIIFKGDILNGY